MMDFKPGKEHQWLEKLVGNWRYDTEVNCGPNEPPMKASGAETVRSISAWIIGEGKGTTPAGEPATMILTLGFDPAKGRYVGTWIGSMMPNLWVYDGELDPAGRKLSLYTIGPKFTGEGTAQYREAMEIVDADHRIFTSSAQGDDGQWKTFMTAHYYRTE